MTRKELLKHLAAIILEKQKDSPVLVGIDGVDASGKTTFAEELVNELKGSGRPIIRASIDGFHNPKSVRYTKGENSPEGYYSDSFNHRAIADVLLDPLSSGKLQYKTAVFDYRTDSEVVLPVQTATNDSILIMEGIFLFRPELVDYWDIKIFVDVDFKITVKRAVTRAAEREYIGAEQEILDKYEKRYIPGQQLYFEKAQPKEKADIIIDNSDFENPVIT
jgi:uridine kinase